MSAISSGSNRGLFFVFGGILTRFFHDRFQCLHGPAFHTKSQNQPSSSVARRSAAQDYFLEVAAMIDSHGRRDQVGGAQSLNVWLDVLAGGLGCKELRKGLVASGQRGYCSLRSSFDLNGQGFTANVLSSAHRQRGADDAPRWLT